MSQKLTLQVLFVDDEPRVLEGLGRQLFRFRHEWDMRFAESGEKALEMLAERPADVVVTDMRMPTMTGSELLTLVRFQYPQTVRIMLSGQTDEAELLKELGPIHQYLHKPCDPIQLQRTIGRTAVLQRLLLEQPIRQIVARINALPPCPETYRQLRTELASERPDNHRIVELISQDPALIAKLMQLVNSSFFGVPQQITSIDRIVTMLGINTLYSIVVASRLFDALPGEIQCSPRIAELWCACINIGKDSAAAGVAAKAAKTIQQQAMLAGNLSLIGRAILINGDFQRYESVIARAVEEGISLSTAEFDEYKVSQDFISAYALGLWGFTEYLVDAVAHQSDSTPAATNDCLEFLRTCGARNRLTLFGVPDMPSADACSIQRNTSIAELVRAGGDL